MRLDFGWFILGLILLLVGCDKTGGKLLDIAHAEKFLSEQQIKLTLKEPHKFPFSQEAFSFRANTSVVLKIARCSSYEEACEFQNELAKHDTEGGVYVVRDNLLLIMGNGPQETRKTVQAALAAYFEAGATDQP